MMKYDEETEDPWNITRNEQLCKLPQETSQIHNLRGGSAVRKERR